MSSWALPFSDYREFSGQIRALEFAEVFVGESYGTTRSAALINLLPTARGVDFNGVIMLSQILLWDSEADFPQLNPGVGLPYQLALPTYAATAWYHHKLPEAPKDLQPLLSEVEKFVITEYAVAPILPAPCGLF